ncbi:MAG: AAA family ATPase, partial [Ruminococcus sp.]|nr:AAA family ATPase [Ruminococcus sp.]
MAKIKSVYICSECGYESPKWYGKCPSCGEWNTMNEEIKEQTKGSSKPSAIRREYAKPFAINEISTDDEHRYDTGSKELNRVLGGGIVKGSLILLGGDPGIGKSTVLMQICQYLGDTLRILYVSGEESKRQLKLRAIRLGVDSPNLYIMTETDVEAVCEQIRIEKPDLVMIDSIQTMNLTELSS